MSNDKLKTELNKLLNQKEEKQSQDLKTKLE